MIMNQKGRGNDNFQTPRHIFEQLNKIFNFEIDIACTSKNCLCNNGFYHDQNMDALKESWDFSGGGGRAFCNPPFSLKAEFIEKAHNEVSKGNCSICVMILPLNSMDTKAWHDFIEGKYHYEILRGRISFIDPETQKPKSGNNSGTVIVYFKKRISIKNE